MVSRSVFDIDYPTLLFYGLLVVLAGAVIYAASTSGTAFGAYNDRWDGSANLRGEATDHGATVEIARNTSAYGTDPATGTAAFILAPSTNYSERDLIALRTFVSNGGTLIVANDAAPPRTGNPLLAGLGTEIRFGNATLRDERYNYRTPAMPVARNVSNSTLTRGVESVTLNHGTAVRPVNATVLVSTSGYAYLDRDGSETVNRNESLAAYPVVVRQEIGAGSVIAISDPSIFINTMLEREGNERFLRNLVTPHSRVILDYSHAKSLPPLVGALLTIRASGLLQILLGVAGVLSVVGWRRGHGAWLVDTLRAVRRRETQALDIDSSGEADADDIAAYLRTEHPDWDAERIERLAESAAGDDE